jgi:chromate transporter
VRALAAITAAVVGVILNLALWFAIHTIFAEIRTVAWGPLEVEVPVPGNVDPWALLLAAAAMVARFRLKWGMLPTLGATAAAGIALHAAGAIA